MHNAVVSAKKYMMLKYKKGNTTVLNIYMKTSRTEQYISTT
jgi:hypothetical protein